MTKTKSTLFVLGAFLLNMLTHYFSEPLEAFERYGNAGVLTGAAVAAVATIAILALVAPIWALSSYLKTKSLPEMFWHRLTIWCGVILILGTMAHLSSLRA